MAMKKENSKGPYNKWASEMKTVMPADVSKEYWATLKSKGQDEADKIVEHYRKQSKTLSTEKQM